MPYSEAQMQIAVANTLRGWRLSHGIVSTHPANEFPVRGPMAMRQVKRAKQSGMLPGIADNLVFLPGGRCLHIELKRKGNKETPAQIQVRKDLTAIGHLCYVVTATTPQEAADQVDRIIRDAVNWDLPSP